MHANASSLIYMLICSVITLHNTIELSEFDKAPQNLHNEYPNVNIWSFTRQYIFIAIVKLMACRFQWFYSLSAKASYRNILQSLESEVCISSLLTSLCRTHLRLDSRLLCIKRCWCWFSSLAKPIILLIRLGGTDSPLGQKYRASLDDIKDFYPISHTIFTTPVNKWIPL